MIYKDKSDAAVERHKERLGLTGDVYMLGFFIESLASHKLLIPTSTATNIEEAEVERIAYDEALLEQQSLEGIGETDDDEIEELTD